MSAKRQSDTQLSSPFFEDAVEKLQNLRLQPFRSELIHAGVSVQRMATRASDRRIQVYRRILVPSHYEDVGSVDVNVERQC